MRQCLAGPARGDGTGGDYLHQPFFPTTVDHEPGQMTGIDRRIRVGHRYHGGEPPGRGRSRSATNIFFPFLPGLPEVDMDVDQSGADQRSHAVKSVSGSGQSVSNLRDPSVPDEQVLFDQAVGRHNPSVGEQSFIHRGPPLPAT